MTDDLDAAIATHIMGLPICTQRFVKWTISGIMNSWDCPTHGQAGCVSKSSIPAYSSEIGWAMLVLAKFKTWSLIREAEGDYTCYLETDWTRYMSRELMDHSQQASADTVPEAVCRAALLTIAGAEDD